MYQLSCLYASSTTWIRQPVYVYEGGSMYAVCVQGYKLPACRVWCKIVWSFDDLSIPFATPYQSLDVVLYFLIR